MSKNSEVDNIYSDITRGQYYKSLRRRDIIINQDITLQLTTEFMFLNHLTYQYGQFLLELTKIYY